MKKNEQDGIDLSDYEGREINLEDWTGKRRESALMNARTRKGSYPRPIHKFSEDAWRDCIATATSNYGEPSVEYYNPYFHDNPNKYGFRLLDSNEASLPGDIVQAYNIYPDGAVGMPYHGYMINEIDENGGIKNINYSNGHGVYHVGDKNHWANDDMYRYRYIGTPAERAAIEEHNRLVRENMPTHQVPSIPNAIQVQPVKPNSDSIYAQIAADAEKQRKRSR